MFWQASDTRRWQRKQINFARLPTKKDNFILSNTWIYMVKLSDHPPHNIQYRDSWAGIGAKWSWVGALSPPVFLTCLEGTWRQLWGLQYSRLSTVKTLLTIEEVRANNTGFLLIIMPTIFPHPQLQPSSEWLTINLEVLYRYFTWTCKIG